jgi:hypothetical protein
MEKWLNGQTIFVNGTSMYRVFKKQSFMSYVACVVNFLENIVIMFSGLLFYKIYETLHVSPLFNTCIVCHLFDKKNKFTCTCICYLSIYKMILFRWFYI